MEPVLGYEYHTRMHLLVTDEDAADFLQSQFTNDLRPFSEGQCTYGLWLDVKGKVLADGFVLCEGEERFRIVSESSQSSVLAEKLERHIIADDVEVEELEPLTGYALVGEGASGLLEALGYAVPGAGRYHERADVVVFGGRRSVLPCFELLCLSSAAAGALRAALEGAGVYFVSDARIQAERIAAGIPLVPVEIGSGDLPGEGGLERDAVSFTKGCYLGQEVVARMHNVGRPQRGLFVLSGSGAIPECPTVLYNSDEKNLGELRSAITTATGWTGVALLKTRFASAGDRLRLASGRDTLIVRDFQCVGGAGK